MSFTILIVDDSPSMRKILMKVINMTGLPVEYVEAGDGQEGLELLEQKAVDVVITDLNMPVMNGFDMIKTVRDQEKFDEIPILVVSTEGRSAFIAEARELGVTDFIQKPFQAELISNTLHKILGVDSEQREDGNPETPDF